MSSNISKTVEQLEKRLEDQFRCHMESSYPYDGFLDEYFDLTPKENLPQCLFMLAEVCDAP